MDGSYQGSAMTAAASMRPSLVLFILTLAAGCALDLIDKIVGKADGDPLHTIIILERLGSLGRMFTSL
jgi:hypothetical protein